VALRFHPGQHHPHLAEVDLGLCARRVLLRDEHLLTTSGFGVDLEASFADVVAYRRVRQLDRAVLVSEAGEHPPSGVALLPGCGQVLDQHRVDRALNRSNRGADRTLGFLGGGSADASA